MKEILLMIKFDYNCLCALPRKVLIAMLIFEQSWLYVLGMALFTLACYGVLRVVQQLFRSDSSWAPFLILLFLLTFLFCTFWNWNKMIKVNYCFDVQVS